MSTTSNDLITIIGNESYECLRESKCLLVGAGGIGSELLKDLVLMRIGEIHVVDLDTIDLSNLNRQFLFRQTDIKKPKACTAVKAVQHYSHSKLVSHQGNIMSTKEFPLHWYSQFDIIYNALDNLAARRYVNKMAQFLKVPIIESGTAGFDGYIQPIIPGSTECFDCTKKDTPKTFPVCTIRSTPSQPVHCIVWAKNFLFAELFQSDHTLEDSNGGTDWGSDNPEEIKRIEQESRELQELRSVILQADETKIIDILRKLFIDDIEKLLSIDSLWTTRAKPVPLNFETVKKATEDKSVGKLNLNQVWPINEQLHQLVVVTKRLMGRIRDGAAVLEFDKDDDDTLQFVATAANIRSHIFHISLKSIFEIKQIAGNIIPAIATTNAIIAGLSSLASLRVLKLLKYANTEKPTELRMAFTATGNPNKCLSSLNLASPNSKCAACSRVSRGVVTLSAKLAQRLTIADFLGALRLKYKLSDEVSILDTNSQRLLIDYDFDDLSESSLEQLKISSGSVLLLTDECEEENTGKVRKPLEIYLDISSGNDDSDELHLPEIDVPFIQPLDNSADDLDTKGDFDSSKTDVPNSVIILDDIDEVYKENDDQKGRKRRLSPDSLNSQKKQKLYESENYEDLIVIE